MAPTTDPLTLVITSYLPVMWVVVLVLWPPTSLLLLAAYRRAVIRSMRTRARAAIPEPGPEADVVGARVSASLEIAVLDGEVEVRSGSAADRLYRAAVRAPLRTAAVYLAAGFGYAATMAAAYLAAGDLEFFPVRFLLLFWTFAWPIALVLVGVAAATRRARVAALAAYFVVWTLLAGVGTARSPELTWLQLVFLWAFSNLLLVGFLSRRLRAVGPLVLVVVASAIFGALLLPVALSNERVLRGIVGLGAALGLSAAGLLAGLLLVGLAFGSLVGWLVLRWIRNRYERMEISEQSVMVDAIWLLFGMSISIPLAFEGPVWALSGLAAFLVHMAVARAGFALLARAGRPAGRVPKLLLLRVFALGRRSERLFGALGTHWRHVGGVRLIAGPDLATSTIEPHEFLDFVGGKLDRHFIGDPAELELRISQAERDPDGDGRFRVHDFFCHDDVWRLVVSRLVGDSDAILMDLRGFSERNSGCLFEIEELINVAPLERVVVLVDRTTDEGFLRASAQRFWARMRPTSPNRGADPGRLVLFRSTGSTDRDLPRLLRALCLAARPGAPLGRGAEGVMAVGPLAGG